jgi:hypothetical protein
MKSLILFLLVWMQDFQSFSLVLDEPRGSANILSSVFASYSFVSRIQLLGFQVPRTSFWLPQEERHSRCSKCMNRDILEKITKLNLKKEILKKLGLKSAPNVTISNHDLSKHLISKLINEIEPKVTISFLQFHTICNPIEFCNHLKWNFSGSK